MVVFLMPTVSSDSVENTLINRTKTSTKNHRGIRKIKNTTWNGRNETRYSTRLRFVIIGTRNETITVMRIPNMENDPKK